MLVDRDHAVGFHDRGLHLLKVTVIMTFFSAALLVIRLQQRHGWGRAYDYDDWAATFAATFALILGIITCVSIRYGYGMHKNELSAYDERKALLMFLLEQIFYKLALNCTKIAILFMYLRNFATNRPWRCFVFSMMALVVGYALGSILATIMQCIPMAKYFDRSVPGVCINLTRFWYTNAWFNLITDVVILTMPTQYLMNMVDVKPRYVTGLAFLFFLGLGVCYITIYRLCPLEVGSKGEDVTYDTLYTTYWTVIEVNLGIICACLPMWKSFLGYWFPYFFPRDPTFPPRHGPMNRLWFGIRDRTVRAFPFSRGRFGASRVSQTSSQAPMIPLVPLARRRGDARGRVPYESTTTFCETILEEDEEEDHNSTTANRIGTDEDRNSTGANRNMTNGDPEYAAEMRARFNAMDVAILEERGFDTRAMTDAQYRLLGLQRVS